jgi:hypothetical protein
MESNMEKKATIFKNRAGSFVIETRRTVILKHALPPVSGFKTRAEAIRTARLFGYAVDRGYRRA